MSAHKARRQSSRGASPITGVDYTGAVKDFRVCSSGKWGWIENRRAGAKTLVRALRKSGQRGKGVREYMCPECARWHVGHMPQETRRGERSASDVHNPNKER